MIRQKRQNRRIGLFNLIKVFGLFFVVFIMFIMLAIIFNSPVINLIVPQQIRSSVTEKHYMSAVSFPSIQENSLIPDVYSGISIRSENPYYTKFSYDNPFLSVSLWLRVDALSTEQTTYVFGNRDISCAKGKQGFGYAIYINNKDKRLYLIWKSDYSNCEKGVIVNTVPLNEWFHIAVVFSTERDGDSDEDKLSYPTHIDLYYNGDISTSLSTQRFLSYEDEEYIVGLSPVKKYALTGRFYHLMVMGYNLTPNEVSAIYRGDKETITTVKEYAEKVIATEYIDRESMLREENERIEIYDLKARMKSLTSRYRAGLVFSSKDLPKDKLRTPKQAYVPKPQPAITLKSLKSAESIKEDDDPMVSRFITVLLHKNETRFMNGMYWYRVPESLQAAYQELNKKRSEHIRNVFEFAWSSYKELAWGHDEIMPVSGFGNKQWCDVGMTLVDGLDTLYLMGFMEDVQRAHDWIQSSFKFNRNCDVSVFEMNIRLVGGFLSMYGLTKDSLYLNKAVEVADALLVAFQPNVYPYTLVNPLNQHASFHSWSFNKVFLSEVGTLSVEFNALSKFTGNKKYRKAVQKIHKKLRKLPTMDGLLASTIIVDTNSGMGKYSMGAMSDSYYEYLLKAWIQGGKKDRKLQRQYNEAIEGMHLHLLRRSKQGLLYLTEVVDETDAGLNRQGLLECFVGGMLALGVLHDVNPAMRERDLATAKGLTYTCMQFYFKAPHGVPSEITEIHDDKLKVYDQAPYYIFRPEAIESLYILNQITGDPVYREWGWTAWKAIERETRTTFGFGHLSDVRDTTRIEDRTESFFFAETLKYFYLLFKDEQVIDLTKQVLNTEAHPIPVN